MVNAGGGDLDYLLLDEVSEIGGVQFSYGREFI